MTRQGLKGWARSSRLTYTEEIDNAGNTVYTVYFDEYHIKQYTFKGSTNQLLYVESNNLYPIPH